MVAPRYIIYLTDTDSFSMNQGKDDDIVEEVASEDSSYESEDEFVTPGLDSLFETRKLMLKYSLKQASIRVNNQKNLKNQLDFVKILKHRRSINEKLLKFDNVGTQILNENKRTFSSIKFYQDLIISGSWDGNLYLLDKTSLQLKKNSISGHQEKVNGLDIKSDLLISGGGEGNIILWNLLDQKDKTLLKPTTTIPAHSNRITKTLYHPISNYIFSTSFDQTWKLWDITTQSCILTQEGHSREIFTGSVHPDGSLFVSSGLDGISHIWDLRSGQLISSLQKHAQKIYSSDFSPNGYYLATASGDCSVKIWDLRKLSQPEFTIPSHTKLVSQVRFFNRTDKELLSTPVTDEFGNHPQTLDSSGCFLVTSSYDGLINIWSSDNWIKVKSLKGHNDKVTSCDIDGSGTNIVSCGWDRTIKLWSL